MKSVKPGRGPSFMGGIGGVIAAVFGVIWIASVSEIDDSGLFVGFGVVFIILAISGAAYNFINATGKKRFSEFDITNDGEETDPLNERFGQTSQETAANETDAGGEFCPYCGAKTDTDYRFCRKCGKEL